MNTKEKIELGLRSIDLKLNLVKAKYGGTRESPLIHDFVNGSANMLLTRGIPEFSNDIIN